MTKLVARVLAAVLLIKDDTGLEHVSRDVEPFEGAQYRDRLGARIGITAVLHTWGSVLTHHPHLHMIVPGGGIALDRQRWVSCRPAFFLPVRVLSRLFRRLFLKMLAAAHEAGRLSRAL